jgi:predicted nucleotidyltransferase
MNPIIQNNHQQILKAAKKHGAKSLKIFGSFARGEESNNSDIDLLVELESGRSLLDLVGLKYEVEELTKRKVDIVTERGLHWYLKERILSEAVSL